MPLNPETYSIVKERLIALASRALELCEEPSLDLHGSRRRRDRRKALHFHASIRVKSTQLCRLAQARGRIGVAGEIFRGKDANFAVSFPEMGIEQGAHCKVQLERNRTPGCQVAGEICPRGPRCTQMTEAGVSARDPAEHGTGGGRLIFWSGRADLNRGPPAPKTNSKTLSSCLVYVFRASCITVYGSFRQLLFPDSSQLLVWLFDVGEMFASGGDTHSG